MRGDALAAVEDLDGGRGQARVDVFVDERVGDGVVMAVALDVIVDVDAGTDFPLAVDERLRRQRAERGLIQPFEKVAAAGAVEPHRPRVEIREELGDPGVEGGEGEEGLVPEAGEYPPLRDLHGDFDLRLVPGLRRPRRWSRRGSWASGRRSRRRASRRRDGPGASRAPGAGASGGRPHRTGCSSTRPDAARDIRDGATRA